MMRLGGAWSLVKFRGWTQATVEDAASAAPIRWRLPLPRWNRLTDKIKDWFEGDATYFLLSAIVHMLVLLALALIPLPFLSRATPQVGHAPAFSPPEVIYDDRPPLAYIDLSNASLEPGELTDESLRNPDSIAPTSQAVNDARDSGTEGGGVKTNAEAAPGIGLGGFDVIGPGSGPMVLGMQGGVGLGRGEGKNPGSGGAGYGFGDRGKKGGLGGGGTKASERAVTAALDWLYRHQGINGSWSLSGFRGRCRGRACTGVATTQSDAAATALGLLPFLAAGQTHKTKCLYRDTVNKGIVWLTKHQGADGDLSAGGEQMMYTHGLATIALCEAYGMTQDDAIRANAQAAVNFIELAQNPNIGAWRYTPGSESGDTSVVGWQVMALKSAQMAGLAVDTGRLQLVERWLRSVAKGRHMGLFSYQPYREPSPTMTSVGLLCRQYLGSPKEEPFMGEGVTYLLENMPSRDGLRDVYYWYYATQVMHNLPGPDWDRWNRAVRRTLLETQCQEDGCAHGSWDPEYPSQDAWGVKGGRLFMTSLSALTLEVYYRYLPLYKINRDPLLEGNQRQAAPAGPPDAAVAAPVVEKPKREPLKRGIWSID